jgi:hypothetical protein
VMMVVLGTMLIISFSVLKEFPALKSTSTNICAARLPR